MGDEAPKQVPQSEKKAYFRWGHQRFEFIYGLASLGLDGQFFGKCFVAQIFYLYLEELSFFQSEGHARPYI